MNNKTAAIATAFLLLLGSASAMPRAHLVPDASLTEALRGPLALPHSSLAGVYTITDDQGNPPISGAVVTTVIAQVPFTDVFVARVFRDDGDGPQPIPGESLVLTTCWCGGYNWVNERGNEGILTLRPGGWRSSVQTGPNAGTVRHLNR